MAADTFPDFDDYVPPAAQSLAAVWQTEQATALRTGLTGVPSGLRELDALTGGWRPGQLSVVAGRPGMGVTSLLLSALRNAAVDFGLPVLYCAPPERTASAVRRLVLGEAGRDTTRVFQPGLPAAERHQLPELSGALLQADIHLLALQEPHYPLILRAAQQLTRPPALLVFDYRDIFHHKGDYGSFAINQCLHDLRELAQTLAIPVLLRCGVSVGADDFRGDAGPRLRFVLHPDLLTRYAALILYLHRPECYGLTEDDHGNPTAGRAELQILYQRDGPSLHTLPLRFDACAGRFSTLEKAAESPPAAR